MNAQLTIRLPDTLEKDIAMLARKLRLKRSDIVRIALERFVQQAAGENENSPYDRVKGGFLDRYDRVWCKGTASHRDPAGFEWDVQFRDGTHINVLTDGRIRPGR